MNTSTPTDIKKTVINSKTNKQYHLKQQKMDEMLLELREIINSNNNSKNNFQITEMKISNKTKQNTTTQNKIINSKQFQNESKIINSSSRTTIDVQSMISQSNKLLQSRKDFSSTKPSIKGKIMAASELLNNEKDMVKSYIKNKIQSEIFMTNNKINTNKHLDYQLLNTTTTTDKHLIRLEHQRKLLLDKKKQQQDRQNNRRKQLIEQVKEFQTDSRVGVGVYEIDNIIFKQQPQSEYLINDNNSIGTHIRSTSNEVKISTQNLNEIYAQHELQETSRINKAQQNINQEQDNLQFVQITDEIETSDKYDQQYDIDVEGRQLRKVLKKYPHFVKVLGQFLKNQWAIAKLQEQTIRLGSMLIEQTNHHQVNSSRAISTTGGIQNVFNGHMWRNRKIKPQQQQQQQSKHRRQKQTISSITQTFKFKPFTITDQSKVQLQRQKISQRRVNKMIGDTAKFHSKKCILTKNELIYYEQKQPNNTNDKFVEIYIPESTKYINLEIQRIGVEMFKKEQGSFFSKKESNVEVVSIKGKARTFKFENDFWQGKELMNDLRKLMSAKVYTLGCKINTSNNLQLLHFIYSPNTNSFNLDSSLVPISCYPIKQDREKHLNILLDSLTDHMETERICLKNAKLQPNEITLLLKLSKKLQKLTTIDLSNMRLGKQNFLQLCQLVNQIKTPPNGLEVILSNCKLDDDCFMSNVGVFTTLCMKVQRLDISNNNITAKTVQIIKNSLQNATSLVKYLNISNCPIRDLTKLNPLIKQSRKLQSLQAQNSFLSFDQKRFEELEKFFDFLKSNNNNNIKLINLSKNGALTRKQYSMIENVWYQQSIEELIIDLDLEMINSEKGGKQLIRTDYTNKNGFTMRLYKPKEPQC